MCSTWHSPRNLAAFNLPEFQILLSPLDYKLCQETDETTKQDAIYTIQFIQNFQDSPNSYCS